MHLKCIKIQILLLTSLQATQALRRNVDEIYSSKVILDHIVLSLLSLLIFNECMHSN